MSSLPLPRPHPASAPAGSPDGVGAALLVRARFTSLASLASLAVGIASAACTTSGATVVSAPSVTLPPVAGPGSGRAPGARGADRPSAAGGPAACLQSWALEDAAGSAAQVLIVCGNDVRRTPVTVGPMTRALDPALEVAHERVCSCAARVPSPAFVDLVITAVPADGRASVEPSEPDAALDADVAQGFLACVGSVPVSFARFAADECGGQGATTYVYSLDVELER